MFFIDNQAHTCFEFLFQFNNCLVWWECSRIVRAHVRFMFTIIYGRIRGFLTPSVPIATVIKTARAAGDWESSLIMSKRLSNTLRQFILQLYYRIMQNIGAKLRYSPYIFFALTLNRTKSHNSWCLTCFRSDANYMIGIMVSNKTPQHLLALDFKDTLSN